jgi:imidazole glycerol-phosphate synthase subunit HisH
MDAVIIDSGGANLASLEFALERLGAKAKVTTRAEEIARAAKVILPGVGSAAEAMRRLHLAELTLVLPELRQPVLGICLGMQLLFERSEEGDTECLGILPGIVRRMLPQPGLPVPHMGWNQLEVARADPLLESIATGDYVYFVHGYAAGESEITLASAQYGKPVAAVVRQDNFWGAQFHPERSARTGARLLENFLRL